MPENESDNSNEQTPPIPPKAEPIFKKPPLVWKETQQIISMIEKKLGGKVVTYYISPGFHMVQDDVKYFYSHLKNIEHQQKLFFILVSPGGDGMSAWRIASLLSTFCEELYIVLPEMAASAATMLSLAADELIMTPLAYLTAVDTSLYHPLNPRDSKNEPVSIELDEVKRAIKLLTNEKEENSAEAYKVIFNYIHPIALGAVERSTNLSEMLCQSIIDLRKKNIINPEVKKKIIDQLNSGYPTHGYPIPRHKAKELGLTVRDTDKELDDYLWILINTYRFMTEPARTDINQSSIHTEAFTKVIESLGSRLVVHHTVERRLDPIIKGWSTFKDEFHWISIFEKEENGEDKIKMSYLDF